MTKTEAHDFITKHYPAYINKIVYFEATGLMARVKAIEPVEGDNDNFMA